MLQNRYKEFFSFFMWIVKKTLICMPKKRDIKTKNSTNAMKKSKNCFYKCQTAVIKYSKNSTDENPCL